MTFSTCIVIFKEYRLEQYSTAISMLLYTFEVAVDIFFNQFSIFVGSFNLQNTFQLQCFALSIYLTSQKKAHKNLLPRCSKMRERSEDVAHIAEVTPRALNTTRSHNLRRILPVMHRVVVPESCLGWRRAHNRNSLKWKESYVETFGPGLPRRAHNAID